MFRAVGDISQAFFVFFLIGPFNQQNLNFLQGVQVWLKYKNGLAFDFASTFNRLSCWKGFNSEEVNDQPRWAFSKSITLAMMRMLQEAGCLFASCWPCTSCEQEVASHQRTSD